MKCNKNEVVKKSCHSRGVGGPQGSGISLIRLHKQTKNFRLKTTLQKGDPQQKPLGMTPNCITAYGFTLIELLVVVLIIGILAAVAVPQYQKAVEKSRIAEAITLLNAMDKAQQVCILEHGWEQCAGEKFWENSTFEPPTPLLDEDECLDTAPCFHTKNWEFYSEDLLYAGLIKNGEIDDTYRFYIGTNWEGNHTPLTCDGECPSSIGM